MQSCKITRFSSKLDRKNEVLVILSVSVFISGKGKEEKNPWLAVLPDQGCGFGKSQFNNVLNGS